MKATVIMVASGKGGTGKSTLSVLMGSRLAAHGKKVLLIELDSGLRSVDIISGVYGKTVYDISDVLCRRCEGDKAIVESPIYKGLSVISAPYEGGLVSPEALRVLINKMARCFDFIVVDTAAGLGVPFKAARAVSDLALLVLTADPVALRDGKLAADELINNGLENVRLVMNRITGQSFGDAVRDLDECIDTVTAQLIAVIPESAQVQCAAACGTALAEDCVAFTALDNLARRILGEQVTLAVRY